MLSGPQTDSPSSPSPQTRNTSLETVTSSPGNLRSFIAQRIDVAPANLQTREEGERGTEAESNQQYSITQIKKKNGKFDFKVLLFLLPAFFYMVIDRVLLVCAFISVFRVIASYAQDSLLAGLRRLYGARDQIWVCSKKGTPLSTGLSLQPLCWVV